MKPLAYLLLVISINANAVVIEKCGNYVFRGKVIKNEKEIGYFYQINANTKSEYRLKIPTSVEHKIAPYVDEFTELNASIDVKLKSTVGELSNISKIKKIPVDPIHLNSKSVKLISEKKCQ